MELQVFVRDDLVQVGLTEDGEPDLMLRYYLVAEDRTGRRFAHDFARTCYRGCAPEAIAEIDALRVKVEKHLEAGGALNMLHWNEVDPAYGSAAYQGLDAWGYFRARERMEAFDAGEPVKLDEIGDALYQCYLDTR